MPKITLDNISDNVLLESTINTLGIFNKEIKEKERLLSEISKEMNNLKGQLLENTQKADSLKEQLTQKTNEADTLRGQLTQKTSEADTLRGQLTQKTNEADTLRGQLTQKTSEADTLRGQLTQKTNEADTLRGQLTQKTSEADTLRGQLTQKTNEADTLRGQLTQKTNEADIQFKKVEAFYTMLYYKIQKGLSEIGNLLQETNGESSLVDYCKQILNNDENSTNKDISHYNEYKSTQDIIDSLELPNSVLNQLANIVWWSEQETTQDKVLNDIPSIKKIAILFRTEVISPLSIAGCSIFLPDFGYVKEKDVSSKKYKNYENQSKLFKKIFDVKLENYTLCSIFTVAYQLNGEEEKIGKMLEYYTD